AGADIRTGAEVTSIQPDGAVRYVCDGAEHRLVARHLLANVAPYILDRLLGEDPAESARPEGAQVKVNLLLKRVPRLGDTTVSAEAAFGGTLHINETYTQLERAHRTAAAGGIPDPLPCEIYCHSITDPSILGRDLNAAGAHTLTVFGLHV